MDRIKKNLGFGCLRLPVKDDEIDTEELTRMVDTFLENGFNYFDTAHGYKYTKSCPALRTCLTSRYPRDSYVFTNKLSEAYFDKQEDIRPFFQLQLETCGVDWFDFYLMHSQHKGNYEKFKRCRAYETAFELKAAGKVRHVGISFHDTADVLERILNEYPQVEVVQLQLNYMDWDDPAVQSRKCWEVCRKYSKPVIVMEPLRGGRLAKLPEDAKGILDALAGGSPASYAIRFAAGHEGVMMVLSGMKHMSDLEDNLSCMNNFRPLERRELAALEQVCTLMRSKDLIPCTACRYCTDGCPMKISIPELLACMNSKKTFPTSGLAGYYYENVHTVNHGKASACVKCGRCEAVCPQHLPIRELLTEAAKEFER